MSDEIVFINGKYLPLKEASVSILDRGFTLGDGLFETLRAYGGHIFRSEDHLDRLFESSNKIFLKIPHDKEKLNQIINDVLKKNNLKEAYVRLTVTRGEGPPGLALPKNTCPTVVVYATQAFSLPNDYYNSGVKVSTFPRSATSTTTISPQIKSCNYLSQIIIRELANQDNAFEGILLEDDQTVTEGTVSNIFIVKDGVLKTPCLSRFILPGVTRKIILELASQNNLPYEETKITTEDIRQADELFIANTGIEILPVSKVDTTQIGNGSIGNITTFLQNSLLKLIEDLRKK
jgi:branched-chain amino acid aminotransferase